jgi:hypothetical protein
VSSTSSLNMFHSKLVDKLRRSLTSKSKDSKCQSLEKNIINLILTLHVSPIGYPRPTTWDKPRSAACFKDI